MFRTQNLICTYLKLISKMCVKIHVNISIYLYLKLRKIGIIIIRKKSLSIYNVIIFLHLKNLKNIMNTNFLLLKLFGSKIFYKLY